MRASKFFGPFYKYSSTQTIANGNLTRGRLRRHHPSALDAGEDGLQLWLWMLSALRAPQAHSTCRFECPHSGSTHLHVVVEPHAPHSHDHMIVCMYHAGSAFLLLHLPTPKESSVASHKCHFRVRHFGRVFSLPYKTASVLALWSIAGNGKHAMGIFPRLCDPSSALGRMDSYKLFSLLLDDSLPRPRCVAGCVHCFYANAYAALPMCHDHVAGFP